MRAATIDVLGLRTRVLVEGERSRGDPVLMIHGVGAWAENFRDVMAPIARTGRYAVAIDLAGFGESEPPGRVSYYGPRDPFYPRFILAALDALDIRSAHLIGNSLGGAVAFMTAVTAPERTRSLTLVAPGGLGLEIAAFLRLATLPGVTALARLLGDRHRGRDVLRTCFYDPARIPPTLYEEVERYGYRSFPEFVRALRAGVSVRGVKRSVRDHWVQRAPRYRGPALVVWGREDAVLPIGHLAAAKSVFPQAEVRIIERCGHLVMIERTDEFLGSLLPFVDGAEATAAA